MTLVSSQGVGIHLSPCDRIESVDVSDVGTGGTDSLGFYSIPLDL